MRRRIVDHTLVKTKLNTLKSLIIRWTKLRNENKKRNGIKGNEESEDSKESEKCREGSPRGGLGRRVPSGSAESEAGPIYQVNKV